MPHGPFSEQALTHALCIVFRCFPSKFACLLYFAAIETERTSPDTSTWLHNVRINKLNGLPDSPIGRYVVSMCVLALAGTD